MVLRMATTAYLDSSLSAFLDDFDRGLHGLQAIRMIDTLRVEKEVLHINDYQCRCLGINRY